MYEGDWADDKMSGHGVLTYPNQARLDGGSARPLTRTLRTQDAFEGSFENDERKDGPGKMSYSDGSVYEGEFLNQQRSGMGRLTYPNGNVYAPARCGARRPLGVASSREYGRYHGSWKDDVQDGAGVLEFHVDGGGNALKPPEHFSG